MPIRFMADGFPQERRGRHWVNPTTTPPRMPCCEAELSTGGARGEGAARQSTVDV
jgi:hypothetical protein